MNLSFTLAARYLSGRKLRTFLTTLAIVFGVMVIFGMNTMLPTMLRGFNANVMAAAGQVDMTVSLITGDFFSSHWLDEITAVEGVSAASGILSRAIALPIDYFDNDPAAADRVASLNLVSIDPDASRSMHSYALEKGRFLEYEDVNAAVISRSLAEATGTDIGGELRLPTPNGAVMVTIVGIMPPRTVPGNEEVLTTLAFARDAYGFDNKFSVIEVNLTTLDLAAREKIQTAIEEILGEDFHIGAMQAGSEMFATLQMAQILFNMFGFLALFMGGFIIYNTFRTIIVERRRDIGMLRALGANRSTIMSMILVESLLQGIVGTAIGLLLGYAMGAAIMQGADTVIQQFIRIKIDTLIIEPTAVLLAVVMGIGTTLAAGYLPARRAMSITPLEALRSGSTEVDFRRQAGRSFYAGLVLIAIALLGLFSGNIGIVFPGGVLLLVGLVLVSPAIVYPLAGVLSSVVLVLYRKDGTGILAESNLKRQPGRVAVTASATMIGLTVLIAAGSMFSSLMGTMKEVVQRSMGSDYILMPASVSLWGSNVGANQGLADEIRAIDGVEVVSTLHFAESASHIAGNLKTPESDLAISMLGIDSEDFPKVGGMIFSKGDESAYAKLNEGRNMIVNGSFVMQVGADLGDSVELFTANGKQTYKIVGVATDFLNVKVTTAFISQENLTADFNSNEDIYIQINLSENADVDSVEASIREASRAYPQFNLISGRAYADQMTGLLDVAGVALYGFMAMLAFPSLIAMINTLAINVIERTREIGMLRAVGATQKQIRRIVIAEAVLLAAIGTAFGLLGGLYLGYAFVIGVNLLMPVSYTFPLSGIVAGIAIGLLFGILAAVYPAREAAKLEIVQALRYE